MKVHFKKLDPRAKIPQYMTPQSAGVDLSIILDSDLLVNPGQILTIQTGLSMEMPEHFEAQIRPRSGLSLKWPNYISNSPGTIDADFRGEIKIIFVNNTNTCITLTNGMRLAQMIFSKVEIPAIMEIDKLSNTERGDGGYGHTGM